MVVADLESFYSDDYTLKSMTTEAYVRDSRFAMHGIAIKWSKDHDARWHDERQWCEVAKNEDWSDVFLVAHHHQFDGFVLLHHYGILPAMRGCTLSMARLLLGNHLSVSLDSVRKHFGLPAKQTPYHLFKGKHWHELTRYEQEQVAAGACDEAESVWRIFGLLLGAGFPRAELPVVDITMNMFCEPVLRADVSMLAAVWERENTRNANRLSELGVSEADLQSSDKFAELLRAEGVEPDKKPGKPKNGKPKSIYAFAKSDEFMKGLLEDENPRVQMLAEARLGVKSSIDQTRAERLGWMARRGPMCVYLKYAGTHSLRYAGGDYLNWQNMRRDSDIRRSIQAPDGYLVAVIDSKQIQCRTLNFLAGQEDIVDAFREERDVYAEAASKFYQKVVTKDTHPLERFIGKKIELGCQFGCGWRKFQSTLRAGVDGPAVYLSDTEAQGGVTSYRNTHRQVTNYWRTADDMHAYLAEGSRREWGPMEVRSKRLWMPNGTAVKYDTLEWFRDEEEGESYWRYQTRNGWKKTYGAALVENAMQALERTFIVAVMVRLRRAGFVVFNCEHDKLGILIRQDGSEQASYDYCLEEMKRVPDWLAGAPLDAEGFMGPRYEQ